MEEHRKLSHPGEVDVRWKCKVEMVSTSCFYRMISETIRIRRLQKQGAFILNSKEEFARTIVPQLEVSIGGKLVVKKAISEIAAEEKEKQESEEVEMKKKKAGINLEEEIRPKKKMRS